VLKIKKRYCNLIDTGLNHCAKNPRVSQTIHFDHNLSLISHRQAVAEHYGLRNTMYSKDVASVVSKPFFLSLCLSFWLSFSQGKKCSKIFFSSYSQDCQEEWDSQIPKFAWTSPAEFVSVTFYIFYIFSKTFSNISREKIEPSRENSIPCYQKVKSCSYFTNFVLYFKL
jgi:hypothetical protein